MASPVGRSTVCHTRSRTSSGPKACSRLAARRFSATLSPTRTPRWWPGLRAAGGVLLGKLNMSEFATGNSVHHPYGTPHNPWDLRRNPGTSSSGSGAATAAFLCATSLGEDTGGSIRNPANNCGLVGIRPTWGLVSRYGMLGACWSMDIGGPISRCGRGLRSDPAGHCLATTRVIPIPRQGQYRITAPGSSGDIKGLRIGVIKGSGRGRLSPVAGQGSSHASDCRFRHVGRD